MFNFIRKMGTWLSDFGGGANGGLSLFGLPTYSGKTVTPENSLQVSAVWCAMKILAETEATLPLSVYRRRNDVIETATEHSLYRILHDYPNEEMSSIDFRMAQTAQLTLWGNCYSRIARNSKGEVIALWPQSSKMMQVRRDQTSGRLQYESRINGQSETYAAKDILHVRAMSFDGINGISPIAQLPNPIGLAMALEEYGARFFANGAIPGVALKHPAQLSPQAKSNLRDSWNALHAGNQHAHNVAVLEEGVELQVVGTNPVDSQSVESRKFQIAEVSRIFRMPLHMLGDLERSTDNNIEQMSLEFVMYTLMPWLEMWEQAINRSLLSPEEQAKGYFVEHNVAGLLRGDLQSRYAAYAIGRNWGWLSVNDILKLENHNGIGPDGDVRLQPMNMQPLGTPAAPKPLGPNEIPGSPSSGAGNSPIENPRKSETELKAAILSLAAMMPRN